MHLHYHTLHHLAAYIKNRVPNAILGDCFTQEKDELIIGLATLEDELWLRIPCTHPMACIWPSDAIGKAKKNVVHLFTELLDKTLLRVEALQFERVILLHFEEELTLVLKMFGMQSNILLMKSGKVVSIFRNSLKEDFNFTPVTGMMNFEPGLIDLNDLKGSLRKVSPIFDRSCEAYLHQKIQEGEGIEEAMNLLIKELETDRFWIAKQKQKVRFSLLPILDEGAVELQGVEKALGLFCRSFLYLNSYAARYKSIENQVAKPQRKLLGQINSYKKSIVDIGKQRSAEEIGNILMANLHLMKEGEKKVELFDFYQNEQITIKLDPELPPHQNAERYFKKQKKRKAQVAHMEEFILKYEVEAESYSEVIEEFEQLAPPSALELSEKGFPYRHMKELRQFLKTHPELDLAQKGAKTQERIPFHRFEKDGFEILVGRSARDNDELCAKHAHKEDLWLHARDVTGSHVIIKRKGGNTFPKPVIEYAAALAARYSKRKHDSVVPVIYTPRKFIRKPKNAYPGQVIVEKEKVVYVEPIEI